MRILKVFFVGAAVVLLLYGCAGKPSREMVEKTCRHMMSISFWKGWERRAEEKRIPKEKHGELRKTAAGEWEKMLSSGEGRKHLDNCVKVYSKLTRKQLKCVQSSKTMEEVKKCVGPT